VRRRPRSPDRKEPEIFEGRDGGVMNDGEWVLSEKIFEWFKAESNYGGLRVVVTASLGISNIFDHK
jgi:hypothetical protein